MEDEDRPTTSDGEPGEEAQQEPPRVPMTPPEGCIRIKEDGGVLKHVLKAGEGGQPCLHARCLGALRAGCAHSAARRTLCARM